MARELRGTGAVVGGSLTFVHDPQGLRIPGAQPMQSKETRKNLFGLATASEDSCRHGCPQGDTASVHFILAKLQHGKTTPKFEQRGAHYVLYRLIIYLFLFESLFSRLQQGSKHDLQTCIDGIRSFSNVIGLRGLSKKVVFISTLFFGFVYVYNFVLRIVYLFSIVMNVESRFKIGILQ